MPGARGEEPQKSWVCVQRRGEGRQASGMPPPFDVSWAPKCGCPLPGTRSSGSLVPGSGSHQHPLSPCHSGQDP